LDPDEHYLSPEACRGEASEPRADLFALDIVMWELLAGERLYRRARVPDTLAAITDEPPPRPSSLRRDLPGEIDDLVIRLFANSLDERFQTAAELSAAIRGFTATEPAVAGPPAPGGPYR
jgi:serine/threonine protein kinase